MLHQRASVHWQHPAASGGAFCAGIALHNFPEGVAVFLASMKSQAVGLSLAVAIALHNVPEGVAVALPVYFATKSRWLGFKYAFLSGVLKRCLRTKCCLPKSYCTCAVTMCFDAVVNPALKHAIGCTCSQLQRTQAWQLVIHTGTTGVCWTAGLAEPAAVIFLALFVPVKLSNEVMGHRVRICQLQQSVPLWPGP